MTACPGPGQRSRFIERAVQHYVTTSSPVASQERLKQAALRDHDLDLKIAADWFAVDQEQWQRLDQKEKPLAQGSADVSTGLNVASVAVFNQIHEVDRSRLIKKLGEVGAATELSDSPGQ